MRVYRSVTLIVALSAAAAASAAAGPLAAQQPGAARLASDTRDASVVRDSAIRQLQGFLQEYPESPLRPNALLQLGELLVQRADELFAERQRATTPAPTPGDTTVAPTPGSIAASTTAARPDYSEAIAILEELVRRYPDFDRLHQAAYTLGTLYMGEAEYADAARTFRLVAEEDSAAAPLRAESFFRLGDAVFEQAARATGAQRRALFADAARAYEQATQLAAQGGDIWFLAQYKLGWAYYNQATSANQQEYRQAVETFDRLIAAYDQLSEEQQSRLGLRQEAIEYMAISFTQIGGAEAASRYFETRGGAPYRLQVLRRVATSLRDQGNFPQAVLAYGMILEEMPTDSSALDIQREIIDIYQNRMLQPDSAQAARLVLVERFAPGSEWARANPGLADSARVAREIALRESGQYLLANAQRGRNQQQFTQAAQLYERYLNEFPQSDSAKAVALYLGEALFGQGDYARAGAAYTRSAYGFGTGDSLAARRDSLTRLAAQNAIVAYDSALARNRTDRAIQDSMFAAVYRFVETFPETETAKTALQQAGRRASQVERWDALERTFRLYVQHFPNDSYTPTAQRLIADAMYQQGQYAEAQNQWSVAEQAARSAGQTSSADSIRQIRTAAAVSFADTLIAQGEYRRAAEEVYVSIADRNPDSPLAPGALRDAIETYRLADSAATARGDEAASREAKRRAVQLAERLISTYPNYELRRDYQVLRASYLADLGQREEAVTALQELVQQNRTFEGRSAAMLRIALLLDSLGREPEAAQAYVAFSQAYPRAPEAADAQWNAAIIYRDAGDTTSAAREFGRFAQRFPSDERAGEARRNQVGLYQASGNVELADEELSRLCRQPTAEVRDLCAARAAKTYFEAGQRFWPQYDALELRITGTLTAAAVDRASAPKLQLRNRMFGQFGQAIQTGHPLYLSGATYYMGLAQWEYGNFLRDVQLPASMPPEQQEAARQASAQRAEEFYAEARNIWQTLLEKAQQENIDNEWIERTRAALRGDVQVPPVGGDDAGSTDGDE